MYPRSLLEFVRMRICGCYWGRVDINELRLKKEQNMCNIFEFGGLGSAWPQSLLVLMNLLTVSIFSS